MNLYHGTSRANWDAIRATGLLMPASQGDAHVSLSECPRVARYFADTAVQVYADFGVTDPVVLMIHADELEAIGLKPLPFVSQVWGEHSSCEWERERAVHGAIPANLLVEVDLPEAHKGGVWV